MRLSTALATFFLLAGMLATEVAMIGLDAAGVVGALFFCCAAAVLVRERSVLT